MTTRLSLTARAMLLSSDNARALSTDDLHYLTDDLSIAEHEELIRLLGLENQSRNLTTLLPESVRCAHPTPPPGEDVLDSIIRNFDLTSLGPASPATPPPSSPELPRTPPRATVHKSVPVTPAKSGGFHYTSPTKEGYNIDWLRAGAISQGVAGGAVAKVPNPSGSFMPAYAVFCGHNVGAHENWIDAHRQITGARSPFQCKFHSLAAAEKAIAYARSKGWTSDSPTQTIPLPLPSSYERNPLNSPTSQGPTRCLECHLNVAGVPNSRFKSVGTLAEAEAVFTALRSSS